MNGLPALPLAQTPNWWSEPWGVADWLETLFSTPLEVHAFLLGAVVGVTIASLTLRQGERTTFALVLVVFLFTFGVLETTFFCSTGFTGCEHVRYKPWYFLGGFLFAYLGSESLKTRYTTYDIGGATAGNQSTNNSIGTPLAGLVVLVLLGFALYSFVTPTPVQPISGLATLGGFVGSAIGLAAFRWARVTPEHEPTFVEALSRSLFRDRDESALVIAYGTVLGFGYPRIIWELGTLWGFGGYPFGPIRWARNGLPSVVVYVFVVFILSAVFLGVYVRQRESDRFGGNRFAALVLGFVTYTFCLFVATGYAGTVWFRVLPAT
ncbi:hypothetical protein ACFQJ7_09905 [Halovenus rubra]|uniref:Prolipoprotein diacylglyceryl transferase n=2 Tax=Halovenus rubra TaxID=869890 RepID=A0ABD5X583_9EURY|nr:hypothetical protein [Halovenus rubra]